MFSFPLSHPLSDVFTVRFIVEMSDAESVVEESTHVFSAVIPSN